MPHRLDPPIAEPRRLSDRVRLREDSAAEPDERTVTHLLTILSVSAGMVGVCLTAIGLIGVVRSLTRLATACDDVLAANSLVYLAAAGLSFGGLRTPLKRHARAVALAVDVTFCSALAMTSAAAVLLVWFVV